VILAESDVDSLFMGVKSQSKVLKWSTYRIGLAAESVASAN